MHDTLMTAAQPAAGPDRISADDRLFLQLRDSLCLAAVDYAGRPEIVHRGGPIGFIRVLDPHTIAVAEFDVPAEASGYAGPVALFLADYTLGTAVTVHGRARTVPLAAVPELVAVLPGNVRGAGMGAERALVVAVDTLVRERPVSLPLLYSRDAVHTVVNRLRTRAAGAA
ncbi:hypothetical protein [Yinghuangia soli]|uniref:Uncharacterized protein n=1 Tax=Yinghuangia soli TaxID=2908204 RepID=A0AA41TYM6_9ACTN|nr:hypothetical protein [Yinghuangia soli]MCF2527968.1 hypothetical protein [Yinghuangia soli]